MSSKIPRESYLRKDFDYTRLTKQELRAIMSENNVEDIPPVTALKSTIIDAYKAAIHDRIDELKKQYQTNFSPENIFQSFSSAESPAEEMEAGKSRVEIALPNMHESASTAASSHPSAKEQQKQQNDQWAEKRLAKIFLNPNTSFINASNASFASDSDQGASRLFSSVPGSERERSCERSVLSAADPDFFLHERSSVSADGTQPSPSDLTDSQKHPVHGEHIPNGSEAVKRKKHSVLRCFFSPFRILLLALVLFAFYLKFYCPYCDGTPRPCILIPPHSKLVGGGKLQCDSGYTLVKSLIDYCAPERSEDDLRTKHVEEIIRLLESIQGSALYGFIKAGHVRLSDLTDDPVVAERVCASDRVICDNGMVRAVKGKIGFRLFVRYYLFVCLKMAVPVLMLFSALKIEIWRRRRKQAVERKAKEQARKAMEILSRQLSYAARSSIFLPNVREDKLRDALDLEGGLWHRTRKILLKNANVTAVEGEGGQILWQWTGPILSDE